MLDQRTMVTVTAVTLALSGLANVLLLVCLAHTWRYWRQVKWYIILLTVGNVLQVAFTQGFTLMASVSHSMGDGSTSTCRFLMFLAHLGLCLTPMALAAMGLHVLLTCISGCQGSRLRHGLVMGLFVLLSLPMPLARMSMTEAMRYRFYEAERTVCHIKLDGGEDHLHLEIGETVASLCFPLVILLFCCIASAVFLSRAARGANKGDEDKSDVVLTAVLGGALFVLWTPYFIASLVFLDSPPSFSPSRHMVTLQVTMVLRHVMNCFPFVSALIAIVFAYLHAFRNRGEFFVPLKDSSTASGERQKLVK